MFFDLPPHENNTYTLTRYVDQECKNEDENWDRWEEYADDAPTILNTNSSAYAAEQGVCLQVSDGGSAMACRIFKFSILVDKIKYY